MEDRVPYIVYESAQAKNERVVKRLVIALIVAIVLIFASNMAWLYAWNSYEYVGMETTTYSQDGEGTNIIGDGNGVGYEPTLDDSANESNAKETK